jgi:hypothetical protein
MFWLQLKPSRVGAIRHLHDYECMRTRMASPNTPIMEAITTMRMKVSLVSMEHSMLRTHSGDYDCAHELDRAIETARIMAIKTAAL